MSERLEPAAVDPMATSLLFDVFALSQAVGRLLGDVMAGGPLSPAEYALYSAIFELEAGSPTALAERLGMPLTTLVDRLREIETRGHARRLPNPADRRSHLVVLTASGLAAHAAAAAQFAIAHRAVLAGLPTSESSARDDLRRVRRAVDGALGVGALGVGALAVSPRRSGDRGR